MLTVLAWMVWRRVHFRSFRIAQAILVDPLADGGNDRIGFDQ